MKTRFGLRPVVGIFLAALAAAAADYPVPDRLAIGALANLYQSVDFDHSLHVEAADDCTSCHHKPFGRPEPCSTCHEDSVAPSAFVHELHWEVEDCTGCHHKQATGDLRCISCHPIEPDHERLDVIGLKGAYHGLCFQCHGETGSDASCGLCHLDRGPRDRPKAD